MKTLLTAAALTLGAAIALDAPSALTADPRPTPAPASDLVARGKYLVTIMGCNDCHTPWTVMTPDGPEPDYTRTLSGHPEALQMPPAPAPNPSWVWSGAATNTAFAGPWGVSFAANLTPDRETGLGDWTEKMFVDTIRNGRHHGRGRPILPPMPWKMYRNASDADLGAIFAYLRSLPPIVNRVPQPLEPTSPPPTPAQR